MTSYENRHARARNKPRPAPLFPQTVGGACLALPPLARRPGLPPPVAGARTVRAERLGEQAGALELLAERLAVDAEDLAGALLVAARLPQHLGQQHAVERLGRPEV